MKAPLDTFFQAATTSVASFDAWARSVNVETKADHIGWKCASSQEFEHIRSLFEVESHFIYQSIISNRRIAVIGLTRSIPSALGDIRVLELSDQKPDGSQKSGFDHIEIYPVAGTAEELATKLAERGTMFEKIVRPHHTTYDAKIAGGLLVRIEAEPLTEKIMREEMTAF